MKIKLALIGLCLLLAGCNPPVPEPIALGSNEPYYGYIDKGQVFGVRIGMSQAESRRLLTEAGQDDPEAGVCKPQDRFACQPGETYDDYYWSANVPSERNKKISPFGTMKHGWISVFVKDGKVTAVGWSFYNYNFDP